MAIALVGSATQVNVAASSTTAPDITRTGATAGNALVALASIWDGNETWTLTDTTDGGNTFTTRPAVNTRVGLGNRNRAVVSWAVDITGGDRTVAFNLAGTAGAGSRYYALGCLEFSGVATSSPEDTFDANDDIDAGTTDANAGPITTTDAGDVLVGTAGVNSGDATLNMASPASWTNSYRQSDANSFIGMDAGYWLPGSTQTTYTAQWAHDNNATEEACAVVVALKPFVGTAAITGTVTETITETDIVSGGRTAIVTLTGDTYVPSLSTTLITHVSTTAISSLTTFTTSFIIALPVTAASDVLLLEYVHRSTNTGGIFGTGGSGTSWTLKHSRTFGAASTFSAHLYWRRATDNHSSQSISVSSLVNSCAAMVHVYRGALGAGDPLASAEVVGEWNTAGNEVQAGVSTDTAGTMVALVVANSPDLAVATQSSIMIGPLTERGDVLATAGTDTSIAHASAIWTGTGDTSTFSWTQTNASTGSFAYAITPQTTSPFDSARQDMINGMDSAQAEGTGWDAVVKAGQHVSSVVRTSATTVTITLSPYGSYNITAQETITVSVPGSILTGGVPILATPTFTIDPAGAPAETIRVYFPAQTSAMGTGGVLFGNRIN